MEKKYGVASDYIKYTSRIKSDTSDGVAVEASQVVDLEEDKLQSDINKELKASIASASGKTYSKSEIDSKDTATLTSAKSYADTKKTEAVSDAATDATTKANAALASAKSYADEKVSALGSVYTTKGSCTAAQLKALTSAKAGDVWNITDAITIDGKAYPAGVNVVCVTAFSAAIDPAATKNWDALQGLQDLTSYVKKSEFEDVAGKIQGVKIYRSTDDNFIIQSSEDDNKKATIGTGVFLHNCVEIGTDVHIGKSISIESIDGANAISLTGDGINSDIRIYEGASIGTQAGLSDYAQIKRNVLIYEEVEIGNNATIGTDAIGTNLIQIRNNFAGKIAIGNDVQISKGVGISVDDSCNLVFGREIQGSYQMKIAATADDLSALAIRVSALEDLLKLA